MTGSAVTGDDLFDDDYLYFFADDLDRESEADTEQIWTLLELKPQMHVLDLGCGHGRIANRLARRGCRVTGLDPSPLFLRRAREDAAALDAWQDFLAGLRDRGLASPLLIINDGSLLEPPRQLRPRTASRGPRPASSPEPSLPSPDPAMNPHPPTPASGPVQDTTLERPAAMATFVLIHGAGDTGWYWHLTEAELQARGHHTIAPDLPCDNDTASLDDYAATVAGAAAGRQDLVIVGQSYGAFTATLAASQLPARLLVLLAGMIPIPGESPGQWWASTGYRQAAEEQARLDGGKTGHDDPLISYYNGVPRPLAEEALRRGGRGESSVVWDTTWPLDAWPDVPTKFILCKDDQFFPAAFLRRLAQQRLGTIPDEVPGCHCVALSHPRELSDLLVSYLG